MKINQHTKISVLIKENSAVIDAIVSINKHFEKLKNPILRKLLASRVSIADAAKIGGTDIQVFFKKLRPLGFICELDGSDGKEELNTIPDFYNDLTQETTKVMDVRKDLELGRDPFNRIMEALAQMPNEYSLKLINTFEPTPLINLLKKKGYLHYTIQSEPELFFTYLKQDGVKPSLSNESIKIAASSESEFQKIVNFFGEKIREIDVRDLEMPLPMVTILNELETLPGGSLLFVHHKKIPQYLLPEIMERGYKFLIKEIGEGNIKLIIYK